MEFAPVMGNGIDTLKRPSIMEREARFQSERLNELRWDVNQEFPVQFRCMRASGLACRWMPLDFFPFSTVFICETVILMIGTGIFWRNN
jgi:hypothetical protein